MHQVKCIDKKSKQNNKTESLINRVKALGYIINTFNADCGHKCYIASSPDSTKHIFIIPDDVKCIYGSVTDLGSLVKRELYTYLSNIEGTLRVVGGKGLISTYCLFHSCSAQSIDLTLFNTSSVTNMSHMFEDCKANSIDLSSFDTSNVRSMSSMFSDCKAQSIDLRSFNTISVEYAHGMFDFCKAQVKVNDPKLKAQLEIDR